MKRIQPIEKIQRVQPTQRVQPSKRMQQISRMRLLQRMKKMGQGKPPTGLFILAAVLAAILPLAACGQKQDAQLDTPNSETQPVALPAGRDAGSADYTPAPAANEANPEAQPADGSAVQTPAGTPTATPAGAPAVEPSGAPSGAPDGDTCADTAECTHSESYANSFHAFPPELADYVSEDKFEEWYGQKFEKTDDCPVFGRNVYEFIKYFDVPREEFERIYYTTDNYYIYDFNIDLLYGGSEKAVSDYYERGGNFKEMKQREAERDIKSGLVGLVDANKFRLWKLNKGYSDCLISWSIPEFVYEFSISERALKQLVDTHNEKERAAGETELFYELDYAEIYDSRRAELERLIASGTPAYLLDTSVRG